MLFGKHSQGLILNIKNNKLWEKPEAQIPKHTFTNVTAKKITPTI